jgi:hypothetical protein
MPIFRSAGLLLLAAAMLLLPATASAFVTDGKPTWPGTTLRYYAAPMPALPKGEVLEAVRAWNGSGARMRLVASTKARAQLVVQAPDRSRACKGVTRTVFVQHKRRNATIRWSLCRERQHDLRIIAHEFGHALGLDHERRKCSVMSSPLIDGVPLTCPDMRKLPAWQDYCALLEADDVRGLVRRYGGRARVPTKRVCDRGPAPAGVTDLVATLEADPVGGWDVRFSWTHPNSPGATVKVVYKYASCPTSWDDPDRSHYTDVPVVAGQPASTVFVRPTPGVVCALVQAFDQWGQPGPASSAQAVVPEY